MSSSPTFNNTENKKHTSRLAYTLEAAKFTAKSSRVRVCIEHYFSENPLKQGQFSHYRPARYFAENRKTLGETQIPREAKQRFAQAFEALNALLK